MVPNKRIKEECPLNPVEHVRMELNEEEESSADRLDYSHPDPDPYEDKFHLPDEGGPYIHEAQDENLSGAPVSIFYLQLHVILLNRFPEKFC